MGALSTRRLLVDVWRFGRSRAFVLVHRITRLITECRTRDSERSEPGEHVHSVRAYNSCRVRLAAACADPLGGIGGEQRPGKEQAGPQGDKPDGRDLLARIVIVQGDTAGAEGPAD